MSNSKHRLLARAASILLISLMILLPVVHAKPALANVETIPLTTSTTSGDVTRQELLKRSPSNMDYFRNMLETSPDIERTVLFPKEKVTPELIKMLRDAPELVFNSNFTIADVKEKLKNKNLS